MALNKIYTEITCYSEGRGATCVPTPKGRAKRENIKRGSGRSARLALRLRPSPLPSPALPRAVAPHSTIMSSELEYLKELHARLSEKIKSLEGEAAKKLPTKKTPAQQLRTVLIGPPGAGA